MSVDWTAMASVHRTEGEGRTGVAKGSLADIVRPFLAAERHPPVLRHGDQELGLEVARALHARDDFPGVY